MPPIDITICENPLLHCDHRRPLRRDDVYADFKLTCGDQVIHVHKVVLASQSEYFDALFRSKLKEEQSGLSEIPAEEAHIMPKLIEFLYGGSIETLRGLDIEDVIVVAHKYDFQYIIDSCIKFMIPKSQPHMAFEALELAKKYQISGLLHYAIKMIALNFQNLGNDPRFEDLDPETPRLVLRDKHLDLGEPWRLESVIEWFEADEVGRVDHLADLLSDIQPWALSGSDSGFEWGDRIFRKFRDDCHEQPGESRWLIYEKSMALESLKLAKKCQTSRLKCHAIKIAAMNFASIVGHAEFKSLDVGLLRLILRDKYLQASVSLQLKSVIAWFEDDEAGRASYVADILTDIDLWELSISELEDMTKNDIFKTRSDCSEILRVAKGIISEKEKPYSSLTNNLIKSFKAL